jgi:hypothetical protein
MLTLYITPVYYIYLDQFEQWLKARRRRGASTVEVEELRGRDLVSSDAHD